MAHLGIRLPNERQPVDGDADCVVRFSFPVYCVQMRLHSFAESVVVRGMYFRRLQVEEQVPAFMSSVTGDGIDW